MGANSYRVLKFRKAYKIFHTEVFLDIVALYQRLMRGLKTLELPN